MIELSWSDKIECREYLQILPINTVPYVHDAVRGVTKSRSLPLNHLDHISRKGFTLRFCIFVTCVTKRLKTLIKAVCKIVTFERSSDKMDCHSCLVAGQTPQQPRSRIGSGVAPFHAERANVRLRASQAAS